MQIADRRCGGPVWTKSSLNYAIIVAECSQRFPVFDPPTGCVWTGKPGTLSRMIDMPDVSLQEEHFLIRLIRAQDPGYQEAASTLIDRLGPFVMAIIRSTAALQDSDLHEVYQQVWLTAFRKNASETFRTAAEFRAWLKQVAVTRCIDEVRKHQRRRATALPTDGDVAEPGPRSEDPRVEALELCLRKLQEVKPEFAVVVRLITSGRSGDDIAAEHGISPNTVYSRFNRAKEMLRECIERGLQ
ncbi:MAG: RNA polymerase sigma factor [Planctomycetaceae bacterium]